MGAAILVRGMCGLIHRRRLRRLLGALPLSALPELEPIRKAELNHALAIQDPHRRSAKLNHALAIQDPHRRSAKLAEMVEFRDGIIRGLSEALNVATSPQRFPPSWHLTRTEAAFLSALLDAPGKVVTREAVYTRVYSGRILSDDEMPEPKILDVILSKIRRKIAAAGHAVEIQTVWSTGWQLTSLSVPVIAQAIEAESIIQ